MQTDKIKIDPMVYMEKIAGKDYPDAPPYLIKLIASMNSSNNPTKWVINNGRKMGKSTMSKMMEILETESIINYYVFESDNKTYYIFIYKNSIVKMYTNCFKFISNDPKTIIDNTKNILLDSELYYQIEGSILGVI